MLEAKVYAPELAGLKGRDWGAHAERDAYFVENIHVDPMMLADRWGVKPRFVMMRQRRLGVRKCANPRDKNN